MKNKIFICIGIIYVFAFYKCDNWHKAAYGGDSWGYYAHLPATFIYGDVGDYGKTIAKVLEYDPGMQDHRIDKYGVRPTPSGKYAIKYSHGMALLWLPFFTIAHFFCKISNFYPADGFSKPYMLMVGLSMIFYVLIGLHFLWKVLARYFEQKVVFFTIISISLATNLFYFTVYNNLMSHAMLFAIYCGLIYATDSFYRMPSKSWARWIAFCVALISLIRMNELYCVFVPLFWGNPLENSEKNWIINRIKTWFQFFAIPFTLFFFALISIQMCYWKYVANQWFYYAYVGETFDFKHPHIIDGLFSFENGWLVWTPIMAFALIGLFWIHRYAKSAFIPVLIIIPLHIYIIYSWWCFTYINGMGSRPMVEMYGLLAFGLAAITAITPSSPIVKNIKNFAFIVFFAFFAWLNIFQTYQIQQGLMVTSECKREFYKEMFGRSYSTHSSLVANMCNEHDAPTSAVKISDLYENNFEDSTCTNFVSKPVFKGKYCYQVGKEFSLDTFVNVGESNIKAGDYVKLSINGFFYEKDRESTRWSVPMIVCTFTKPDEKEHKSSYLHISSFIGNKTFNFWHTGTAEEWGEAYFYVKVPKNIQDTDNLKIYVWNPTKRLIFLDDLKVELWR